MTYSLVEKRKMENILAVFQDYIQPHPYFDILYSEKIGYIRVSTEVPEWEGVVSIHSADKLLSILFNEIISDILFRNSKEYHCSTTLDVDEIEEIRSRITVILEELGEEADYCLDFLNNYLEDHLDNDIEQ